MRHWNKVLGNNLFSGVGLSMVNSGFFHEENIPLIVMGIVVLVVSLILNIATQNIIEEEINKEKRGIK